MPTRSDIIKAIQQQAKQQGVQWFVAREGGNHTTFCLDGVMIPIARHPNDFGPRYAEIVYKQCEPVFGKGWWRR